MRVSHTYLSAGFVKISCAHFKPAVFHPFEVAVAVIVTRAAVSDTLAVGICG